MNDEYNEVVKKAKESSEDLGLMMLVLYNPRSPYENYMIRSQDFILGRIPIGCQVIATVNRNGVIAEYHPKGFNND